MDIVGARVVVTGAARGIGAELAVAFAQAGAAGLVIADLDADGLEETAARIASPATHAAVHIATIDVAQRDAATALCDVARLAWGGVDVFCANAGIASGAGLDASDEQWNRLWAVNTMSVADAGRAMANEASRLGGAHLVITASAAGLLTNLGDAAYTATKHATVGLAEWIAITHGPDGLRVSCLCPQGVRTPMVTEGLAGGQLAARVVESAGLIEPEDVAACVVRDLTDDAFLILPHPEVARYEAGKVADRPAWISAMQRLHARLAGSPQNQETS